MAISTNGTIITRLAGALYGEYLSNASYTEVSTTAPATVAANWLTNDFAGKTDAQIATTILTNLGLTSIVGLNNYVAGQLTAAGSSAAAKGAALVSMLNGYAGMTADAVYGTYATSFNAKVEASLTKSQTTGQAGGSFATADVVAVANKSLALTTGVDTTLVGGAGDDTYTALTTTLTAGDQLSGGAGADTLALTSATAGTYGAGVTATGVETVRVTATAATSVDASLFAGVTTVENTGSIAAGTVTVTGLKAIPAINSTATNSSTTVSFADANVAGGAADAATVNLSSSSSVNAVTVTADGVETLNVVTAGAASGTADSVVAGAVTAGNAVTVASNTLAALNVSGTAGARIVATLPGATTLVTGVVTSAAGADDITVNADATDKVSVAMGAGNDTVRLNGSIGVSTASWTVSGGEGTDTLVVGTGVDSINGANVSDFEAVRLTNASTVTLSTAKNTVSSATFDVTGGSFTGLAAGGTANLTTGGNATVANTAWTTGTADSLTVNIGSNSLSGATTSTITATGIETATVNLLAAPTDTTSARSVGVTSSSLKTLTVNGSQPTTITSAAGNTALTTVNASGVTANVTATGLTTATAGVSITSGGGNDVLTTSTGADTLSGGAGNDSLSGAAGNDVIDGGDGVDTISGGEGVDQLTGGTGADVFVFSANATTATPAVAVSTLSAIDTITDFVSGTDKLSGTGAVAFLGNFANIQAALAAQNNGDAIANRAAFITGENALYVFKNTGGTLNVDDLVIKLNGVTSLAAGDLLLGSQGTGNAISLTAASAVVRTTGAVTNASATTAGTNSPVDSANTTDSNDTITSTVARAIGSTIDGGAGTDTLALSIGAAGTGTASATNLAAITNLETITLANRANTTADTVDYSIAISKENVADNSVLTITSSHTGLAADGSLRTAGATIDASNITGNRANGNAVANAKVSITGGSAQDVITGGDFNDTINGGDGNDSIVGGAGTNSLIGGNGDDTVNSGSLTDLIDGGAGNDLVTLITGSYTSTSIAGGAGAADVLSLTASTNIQGATISGFETLNVNTADAGSSVSANLAQLAGLDVTRTTISAANLTIAVKADTAASYGAGALTADDDVKAYTITGAASVGGVTVTLGTAASTLAHSITGGAGNDIIDYSSSTGTAAQTLIGGGGDDTIRLSGATLTATDTITGGTGTDTFAITGNTAIGVAGTHIALTGVTQIEAITIANTTTGVYLTAADTVATGNLTVTTSQTTGPLFFTSTASTAGNTVNVTGGGGDDSITGGALADTLSGGNGSDTLVGGAGNDQLNSGANNDNVDGGLGVDAIDTGTGSDTVNFAAATNGLSSNAAGTLANTTWYTDTIALGGFDRALDSLRFSAGQLNAVATSQFQVTLSSAKAGADITAGDAIVSTDVAINATTDLTGLAGVSSFLKFTNTTATSYASAIGTGSLTTANLGYNTSGATEGVLASWYDSTNSQAVIGFIMDSTGANAITSGDAFVEIVRIGLTSADYTSGFTIGTFLA
jgi:Ca2+-binding RTX toxin-like protein